MTKAVAAKIVEAVALLYVLCGLTSDSRKKTALRLVLHPIRSNLTLQMYNTMQQDLC